ncbi:MAG: hypothetical protein LBL94_12070 [Prevotellaceae bacterium]|nr:hypothetical protein [Prevotellaceae bacterium]
MKKFSTSKNYRQFFNNFGGRQKKILPETRGAFQIVAPWRYAAGGGRLTTNLCCTFLPNL